MKPPVEFLFDSRDPININHHYHLSHTPLLQILHVKLLTQQFTHCRACVGWQVTMSNPMADNIP